MKDNRVVSGMVAIAVMALATLFNACTTAQSQNPGQVPFLPHAGPNSPVVVAGGSLYIHSKSSGVTWTGGNMQFQTSDKVDLSLCQFGFTYNNKGVPYPMLQDDTIVIDAVSAIGGHATITLTAIMINNGLGIQVTSTVAPTLNRTKKDLKFGTYNFGSATVNIKGYNSSITDTCDPPNHKKCFLGVGKEPS
jgi:hypothetical protein